MSKVTFPAIRGTQGKREFYSIKVSLGDLATMFSYDPIELPPEQRHQRQIQRSRIPKIARYMIENEDGYIFSSIVAAFSDSAVKFTAANKGEDLGHVTVDLEKGKLLIVDGQHRSGGVGYALNTNPDLGDDTISVLLYPQEGLERMQQMFSDLNREVVKTPKPLNILFDKRDQLAQVVLQVVQEVPAFTGLVDKERVSLGQKSIMAYTLLGLYQATQQYFAARELRNPPVKDMLFADKVKAATEFWTEVSASMVDWFAIYKRLRTSADVRTTNVSTHSVIIGALGAIGGELQELAQDDWKERVKELKKVDWRKTNPEWHNTIIVGGSVISNRQARVAAREILWKKLLHDLPVTVESKLPEPETLVSEKPKRGKAKAA